MCSSLGLQVVVRVPVTVKDYDCVCRDQVDAQPPGPSAQQETGKLLGLQGEGIDAYLPIGTLCKE